MSLIEHQKTVDGGPLRIFRNIREIHTDDFQPVDINGNLVTSESRYSIFSTVYLNEKEYGVLWGSFGGVASLTTLRQTLGRYLSYVNYSPTGLPRGVFLMSDPGPMGSMTEIISRSGSSKAYSQSVGGLIRKWYIGKDRIYIVFSSETQLWNVLTFEKKVYDSFECLDDAIIYLRFNATIQSFF